MSIQALKMMKEQLMSCVQGQLGDISRVDAKELGQAIDMIKDLSEAIYYCTITESMEKVENQQKRGDTNINYYTSKMMYPDYRNMERENGYMYYGGGSGGNSGGSSGSSGGNSGSTSYYTELPHNMIPNNMMRDPREGRSPMRRRMYMEGKQTHNDPNSQLHELQAYLHELSTDITEMIKDASPEEKTTLRQKMTTLASKIA